MPRRPKSVCRQAGCGALLDKPGHCPAHTKEVRQRSDEQRGSASERGYTSAWSKARGFYLASHPLCPKCKADGLVRAATVVDHIVPHRLKEAIDSGNEVAIAKARVLFWDSRNNWQPLCKPHHDAKTAKEDGGFGRIRSTPRL